MSSIDVMNVIPELPGEGKRELDVRLTQVMDALDRTRGYQQRWRVVARGAQREQAPARQPNGPAVSAGQPAPLHYAAWHAHIAGHRRWMPGIGDGAVS